MTYDELMACKIEQELIYLDQISNLMRERDEARALAAKLEEELTTFRRRDEEARGLLVLLSRSILGSRERDGSTSE